LFVRHHSLSSYNKSTKLLTSGVGEDVADFVDLRFVELSGSALDIDLGLVAHKGGKSATDTLDGAEGEGHLNFSVNIGILHTEQVREFTGVLQNEARLINTNNTGI